MSTTTTRIFPTVEVKEPSPGSDLRSGRIGESLRLSLWSIGDGSAEVTMHHPTSTDAFYVSPGVHHDGFISVKASVGSDEVGAYLRSVEDAVALRDALNNAIADAERDGMA